MTRRYRFRRPLTRAYSLDEQLDDVQWDYLMWNVQATGGPRLRSGTVTFVKHTDRSWGWPLRARPRWRGMRHSWRYDAARPWLRRS